MPRLFLVLFLLSAGWIASAQQPAQTPQPPTVTPNFTRSVRGLNSADVRSSRFQYDAGARSYWHSHEGIQILLPERGSGRMQLQGQKMQELTLGQPVVLPAGVMHWHGAAPDQGLTQIAVNVGAAKWGSAVTDDEYLGRK